MPSDNPTPAIEGYEPPELWDIGELAEFTEEKKANKADFQSAAESTQQCYFS
jgi:hypothetical protein